MELVLYEDNNNTMASKDIWIVNNETNSECF